MLEQIVDAVGRESEVHDWAVRRRRTRSVQLYLIGRSIENLREVESEEYELEVFNDHAYPPGFTGRDGQPPSGDARGVASVKLVPADRGRLRALVGDAVTMARLVHNPPYYPPEAAEYPDVPLADAGLATAASSRAAAEAFAEEVWGLVEREPGVRLSAAELFLTLGEVELHNSRGVRAGSSATRILSEIVLLASENGDEAEHFRQIEVRRLSDLRLEHNVAEAARFARDTLRASAPKTRHGPVVLGGEALVSLFDAFTFQASGRAAYMKLSSAVLGESVFGAREIRGDALTLRSNALRPYGVGSYSFDRDGVPGTDVAVIEGGVLRRWIADQRYAQYLGVPVTGEAATTEVAPGATSLPQLLDSDEPLVHVVQFSAPEVDPVTGDFGSEIRLAYETGRGEARPIKGGSVSGNVFDAFADARFASGVEDRRSYHGPEAVRFAALRIAGDAPE